MDQFISVVARGETRIYYHIAHNYHTMSLASHVVEHVIYSPVFVAKTMWRFVVPWFMPSVSINIPDKSTTSEITPKSEIEMGSSSLYGTLPENDEINAIMPYNPPDIQSSSGNSCTDLVVVHSETQQETSSWPRLIVAMPSFNQIGSRALTSLIIDLPIYTCKNLYNNPLPTLIMLYTVLPAPVWNVLFPKLLRYASLL